MRVSLRLHSPAMAPPNPLRRGRLARGLTFTLVQVYAHGLGLGGLLPFCGSDHRRTSHAPKGVMNGYRIGPATKKIYRLRAARRIEVHHPPTLSPLSFQTRSGVTVSDGTGGRSACVHART
jgi:hypothetical protein